MRLATMTALTLVLGLAAVPAVAQSSSTGASGAAGAQACLKPGAAVSPEAFNRLDDNGDGFVSMQEYIEKCGKAGAAAQNDDDARAQFASLDADRDQKLSADEFKSAASAGTTAAASADNSAAGASTTGSAVPLPSQTRSDAAGRPAASTAGQAATGNSLSGATAGATSSPSSPLGGMEADRIIGMDVVNAEGKEVGEIKDLVLDQQQVAHAVISVGGFLGIGAKDVAVPFEQLRIGQDNVTLMSDSSEAELKQMPEYKKDSYTRIERKAERSAPAERAPKPAQ
jgi:sporulation protein YlmC with PRC-barrel domain